MPAWMAASSTPQSTRAPSVMSPLMPDKTVEIGEFHGDGCSWTTVTLVLIPPRGVKAATSFMSAGLQHGDEVVENAVGDVLVENALVAKALQIHLQALQLDALLVGRVGERERAEIGLAGLGTNRRELGADDFDDVIAAGKLVVECFQDVAGVGGHIALRIARACRLCRKAGLVGRAGD